jgi:hypothetical protein
LSWGFAALPLYPAAIQQTAGEQHKWPREENAPNVKEAISECGGADFGQLAMVCDEEVKAIRLAVPCIATN